MRRRAVLALAGLACLIALGARAAPVRDEEQVRAADQALFLALTRGDGAAAGKLLDPKFTWTDSDGRTLAATPLLKTPPKPGPQVGANLVLHLYDRVAVLTTELEHVHALRVWVKGKGGWRALLYHEVKVAETAGRAGTVEADCENPCRTVPYVPRTQEERDVLASWQALEQAVAKGDGKSWATHVADEFTVVGNARIQDKAARIEAVNRGGSAPPPLVSASMFDYGDTVVMTCLHQPYTGKPIRVSRVWVKRNGAWLMAISYQTIIQAAKST